MNEYFEKARELGRLILSSEQSLRLSDAHAALDSDPAAQTKIVEFTEYQAVLRQAADSGHMDADIYDKAVDKLASMRKGMLELDAAKEYIKAQEEFDALADAVINVLEVMVKGDSVDAAKKGCGGCGKHGQPGGCGSH